MELLRPGDVFFLHVEKASAPQHTAALAFLEVPGGTAGWNGGEELRALIARRAAAEPLLRARLACPPFGIARPTWVDAGELDVGRHVRRHLVPAPGGWAEVRALVEELMALPMERDAPLWRFHLMEGWAGGQPLVLLTVHHSLADGIGVVQLAAALMDEQRPGKHPKTELAREPSGVAQLAWATLAAQAAGPVRALAGAARGASRDPRGAARRARWALRGVCQLARGGTAPRSPINGVLGAARRLSVVTVELREVRLIRRAFGSDTADIVLAALADALHRLFDESATEAPAQLRAMVPLSRRRPRGRVVPGNWSSATPVSVPVVAMGVEERLVSVTDAARRALHSAQPAGADLVMRALGTWLPAGAHRLVARMVYRSRWFNMIVSTIPGPAKAPMLAGAMVRQVVPVLPLAEGVGLAVGALLWGGRLTLGITTDPVLVDGDRLGELVEASLGDLADAARKAMASAVLDEDAPRTRSLVLAEAAPPAGHPERSLLGARSQAGGAEPRRVGGPRRRAVGRP